MILVGRGKIDVESFKKMLEKRNRTAAGYAVPARGLVLEHVYYDSITDNP